MEVNTMVFHFQWIFCNWTTFLAELLYRSSNTYFSKCDYMGFRIGETPASYLIKHSFIYLVTLWTNCPNSGIPNLGNWESPIGDDIVTYFFGYLQKNMFHIGCLGCRLAS